MLYLTNQWAVATKEGWLTSQNSYRREATSWHYNLRGRGHFELRAVIIPKEYAL